LNNFIIKFKDIVDLQITQFENNFIQNKNKTQKIYQFLELNIGS